MKKNKVINYIVSINNMSNVSLLYPDTTIASVTYCCQICWFLLATNTITDYIPFANYIPQSVNCTISMNQYSNQLSLDNYMYELTPELSIGCNDNEGYITHFSGEEYIGTYGDYVEYSDTAITRVTSYGCEVVDEINNIYDQITSIDYLDFIIDGIDDIIFVGSGNKLKLYITLINVAI